METIGFNAPLFLHTLNQILDANNKDAGESSAVNGTLKQTYKAKALTKADVKELPDSYVFAIDMPGMKSTEIQVQVKDDNVLLIRGERKREEEKEGVNFMRMERKMGKFLKEFVLPENANVEKISAACQDGVLTVTIEKLLPPEPKQPKIIEVMVA